MHIFQPGGYTVRTQTSALGVYAGIMPTGPAEIYFEKYLYASRNLSIWVSDNIQVGGWQPWCLGTESTAEVFTFSLECVAHSAIILSNCRRKEEPKEFGI